MTLALQDRAIVQTTPSLNDNLSQRKLFIFQVIELCTLHRKSVYYIQARIAGKPDAFDRGLVACQVTPDRLRRYQSDDSYLSLEELTTQGTRIVQSEK
jgi:hypothetical protein